MSKPFVVETARVVQTMAVYCAHHGAAACFASSAVPHGLAPCASCIADVICDVHELSVRRLHCIADARAMFAAYASAPFHSAVGGLTTPEAAAAMLPALLLAIADAADERSKCPEVAGALTDLISVACVAAGPQCCAPLVLAMSRMWPPPPGAERHVTHVVVMESLSAILLSLEAQRQGSAADDQEDSLEARMSASRDIMTYISATAMGAPAGARALLPSIRAQVAAIRLLRVILIRAPDSHVAGALSAGVAAAGGLAGLLRVLRQAPGSADQALFDAARGGSSGGGGGGGADDPTKSEAVAEAMVLVSLVVGAAPTTPLLASALAAAMRPGVPSASHAQSSGIPAPRPGSGGGNAPLAEAIRPHLLSRGLSAVGNAAELIFAICSVLPQSIGVRGCLATDVAEYLYEALRTEEHRPVGVVLAISDALCALGSAAASTKWGEAASRDADMFAWHSRGAADIVCPALARRGARVERMLGEGGVSDDVRALVSMLRLAVTITRSGAASDFHSAARVLRTAVGVTELIHAAHGGQPDRLSFNVATVDIDAEVTLERLLHATKTPPTGSGTASGMSREDPRTGVTVMAACSDIVAGLLELTTAVACSVPSDLGAEAARALLLVASVGNDTAVLLSGALEIAGSRRGLASDPSRVSALWCDTYMALETTLQLIASPGSDSVTAAAGTTAAAARRATVTSETEPDVRNILAAQILRALTCAGCESDPSAIAGCRSTAAAWASLASRWHTAAHAVHVPSGAAGGRAADGPGTYALPRSLLLIALAISDAAAVNTDSDIDGHDVTATGMAGSVATIISTAAVDAGLLSTDDAAEWARAGALDQLPRDVGSTIDALEEILAARASALRAPTAADESDSAVHIVCAYATILHLVLPAGAELPAALSEGIVDAFARTGEPPGPGYPFIGRNRDVGGASQPHTDAAGTERSTLTHNERVALLLLYCHLYNDTSGCASGAPDPPHAHVCAAVSALIGRGGGEAVAFAAVRRDVSVLVMMWETASFGDGSSQHTTAAVVVRSVSLDCMTALQGGGAVQARAYSEAFMDLIQRAHAAFFDWILDLLASSSDGATLLSVLSILLLGCSDSVEPSSLLPSIKRAPPGLVAASHATVREAITRAFGPSGRGAPAIDRLLTVLLPPIARSAAVAAPPASGDPRHEALMSQLAGDETRLKLIRDALALRTRGIVATRCSLDVITAHVCRAASLDIARRASAIVQHSAASGSVGRSALFVRSLLSEVLIECLNNATVSLTYAAVDIAATPAGHRAEGAACEPAAAWIVETSRAAHTAMEVCSSTENVPHRMHAVALAGCAAALLHSDPAAATCVSLLSVLDGLEASSPVVREAAFTLTAVCISNVPGVTAMADPGTSVAPSTALNVSSAVGNEAPYMAVCIQNSLMEGLMLCGGPGSHAVHDVAHSLDLSALVAMAGLIGATSHGSVNPAMARVFDAPTWEVVADMAAMRIHRFVADGSACPQGVDISCLVLAMTMPLRHTWPASDIPDSTIAALNALCTSPHGRRHGLLAAVTLAVCRARGRACATPSDAAGVSTHGDTTDSARFAGVDKYLAHWLPRVRAPARRRRKTDKVCGVHDVLCHGNWSM